MDKLVRKNGGNMQQHAQQSDWLHVIICSKDEQQYYMGMHDKDSDIDFVPVFASREDADQCLLSLGQKNGIRYQVEAVFTTEILKNCSDRSYLVALVDKDGKIIKQFSGEE